MMISSGGQVKISKNFKIVYNLLILFVILFVVGNIRISNIDDGYINRQFLGVGGGCRQRRRASLLVDAGFFL